MLMRKTILSVLLVLGLTPLQADDYDYLWLHSPVASGTRSYAIDDLRKITFGGKALQVHLKSQASPVTWAYSNLWKMTFESGIATAVDTPQKTGDLSIITSPLEIRVESPTPLKYVAVYQVQGRRLALFGQGETTASYSLNALPMGIYVVRAENAENVQSIKFVKH